MKLGRNVQHTIYDDMKQKKKDSKEKVPMIGLGSQFFTSGSVPTDEVPPYYYRFFPVHV